MNKTISQALNFLGIVLLSVIAVTFLLRSYPLVQNRSRPKNLILISIDTLRADSMGVYGYKKDTTPNIDAFAKRSTVFTNAYTQVPATYPSFAALMTGLSPFESGIYSIPSRRTDPKTGDLVINKQMGNLPIDNNTKTLAERLKEQGFITQAFLLNPVLHPTFTNMDQGFDGYEVYRRKVGENPKQHMVTNKVMEWLNKRAQAEAPFFLWVHYLDPHAPYEPEEKLQCKFNKKYCSEINKTGPENLRKNMEELTGYRENELSGNIVDLYKTLYDGEIFDVDTLVGNILNKIKSEGLDKNSIIVILSDHGESFEKKYYFSHTLDLYETSVKVPLIVYFPGRKSSVDSQLTENSDLVQKLLDDLGVEYEDIDKKESDYLIFNNIHMSKFAIRKGKYKYLYSKDARNGRPEKELFDLSTDPAENRNIAGDNKNLVAEMHNLLMKRLENSSIRVGGGVVNTEHIGHEME